MNRELPDVQAVFRKGRGTRDQIANIRWIFKKAKEFKKASMSALLTMSKPLTVWITTNCGKFLELRIPDHLTCLLRNGYVGQEEKLEPDAEQLTGSKLRKEYDKAVYCHSVYLT